MFRSLTIVVASLALFIVSSLGLNRGVVLHVDDHGHLVLESAHVLHAHYHDKGADHESDDFYGYADHGELHAAMACDSDAGVNGERGSGSSSVPRPTDSPPLRQPIGSMLIPTPSLVAAETGANDFWGSTAHPELACLRAVVLLV